VDRTKAQEIGFTQREVANNLLITLSGSFQTAPTFWLNPKNSVSYQVATQTPQYLVQSLQDLENIPVTGTSTAPPAILASLASFSRNSDLSVVSHYNVAPVIDIFGSVQGRDLGAVSKDIFSILKTIRGSFPGFANHSAWPDPDDEVLFLGLLTGLAFAIVLVYLLIVVNFQSWLDPFIILMALPATLAELCGSCL